jgi:hypothetical protein
MDGLLFTIRSAKKPASAANPKTTAGCCRVKSLVLCQICSTD